jgi:ubiquinone biosynthesis protein
MRQRYAPGPLAHRLGRAGLDSLELGMELPMQTKRLLKELERGNIEIRAKPIGMEPILERLEQLINRLVLALIASAFIIALAVLLQVYHPPGWQAFVGSLLGVAFVLAAVLGIYLAWTIASPRHKS